MKSYRLKSGVLLFLVIFSTFFMININFLSNINSEIEPTNTSPIKASAYTWINPILISVDSDDDAIYPDIAVDEIGNVHIVWEDYSDNYGSDYYPDILYRGWNAASGAFTSIALVSSISTNSARDPDIAVDNAGNVHVVWTDYTNLDSDSNSDIYYRMWNKSTNTWGGHSSTYDLVTTGESNACDYPAIAVDFAGNIHVVWTDNNIFSPQDPDTIDDIYYKCWNATNRVWSSNRTLVSSESISAARYPSIATDNQGNVHIAWEDDTNPYLGHSDSSSYPDIFYKYRNATTGTWSVTEIISNTSTSYAYRPSIAADGLGNVHITWYDYTNIFGSGAYDYDIFYRVRDFVTGAWSGHVNATDVVSLGTATAQYPQIAATALGNVFVVWEQYDFGGISYNIVQRIWNETSHLWEPIEPVAQDDYDDTKYPSVAVDMAGNSYVTWQWDYTYFDIYYRRSIITAPMTPVLYPINPNPNPNLDNQLIWTNRMDATLFYVYKNTSFITSTAGLTPIAVVSSSSYADVVSDNGTYYYAIVAENMNGNSSISNCVGVNVSALMGSSRVRITKNADFARFASIGNGSAINPWIIRNWFIDGMGSNGIYISNTTDHFILQDNTVFGCSNGIYLENAINGQIINNTAKFNMIGFKLKDSSGNMLINNTSYNNSHPSDSAFGFALFNSNSNWFQANHAYNNNGAANLGGVGFYLYGSKSNNLIENAIYGNVAGGIFFEAYSNFNNVTRNQIFSNRRTYGYGICFDDYDNEYNRLVENNIYDQYYGIQSGHAGPNYVINNSLHDNRYGMYTVNSNQILWEISYNKFFNNYYASDLWIATATFYKNEVWNNTNGLTFFGVGGSILINNTAWNNTYYGFYTSSQNMKFYNNTAIRNGYGFGIDSWSIIMENNFVSESTYGFYLGGTEYVRMRYNTIINSQYGIYCENSNHTAIIENTIRNSTQGIHLLKNLNTTVRLNEISNNSNYGIYIENVNNSIITWNEMLDNRNWINYKSGVNNTVERNMIYRGPTLYNILPNPVIDGWVHLNWQKVPWSTYYLVYRKFSAPITSFRDLFTMNYILNVTLTQTIDSTVPVLGNYSYVIVAGNATCWTLNSNNQWVNVSAYPKPATPILDAIFPSTSYNGQVKLEWNDAQNSTRYYVYKHTSSITPGNIGTLAPLAKVTQSTYIDNVFVNGTYYYAIVAGNPGFNSSVSNCRSVIVQRLPIPAIPTLNLIVPYPDYDGIIKLDWADTVSTTKYYVYRDTAFITGVTGRIPYATVTQSNYTDIIAANTTCYYVIVAGNLGFNGSMSVCRNVTVILYSLPTTPILSQIIPGVDYYGIIQLNWTDTINTAKYYVYRNTTFISTTIGLTPIATVFQSDFIDVVSANGTFYYAIVASNPSKNSSISNCRSVTVMLYSVPGIPILNSIQPFIDYDGIIKFNWTSTAATSRYYIYREQSFIFSITGLQPIAIVTTGTTYTDVLTVNGTYFYAVLAGNPGYNGSASSNCQFVVVNIIPPPGRPFLEPIKPSYNGLIQLNWNDTINTIGYYIYRDTSLITSVGSRTPYMITATSNLTDFALVNGTLYYAIVATNFLLNGSLSNCQSVTIAVYPPPSTPILNFIFPKVNTYGIISLNWTDTINTVRYYVYKSNSFILNVSLLVPIAIVTQSAYTDSEPIDGIYYYVIVAGNPSYNSSISNCENVTINLYNPPETPILSPINPSLDYDGKIQLEWPDAINATKYYIYQDTAVITNITSRIPIIVIPHSDFPITGLFVNDTFYYAVMAGNTKFNSSISNCENVTVIWYSKPSTPTLSPIVPGMDYDGIIYLDWTDTPSTTKYYIFRDTSLITSVDSRIPYAIVFQSNYTDVIGVVGTYYYVVVAVNPSQNSSISQCWSVTVARSNPPSDYTWIIIIIVIGACAVAATLIVFKVRSKPKRTQIVSQQIPVIKDKLRGIKSGWKENLSIDDKIRALQRNNVSIEELTELSDADLTSHFSQTFLPIPIKLIEFLQRLDAPLEDKAEIIAEFNNLSEEQKLEYLRELTEL